MRRGAPVAQRLSDGCRAGGTGGNARRPACADQGRLKARRGGRRERAPTVGLDDRSSGWHAGDPACQACSLPLTRRSSRRRTAWRRRPPSRRTHISEVAFVVAITGRLISVPLSAPSHVQAGDGHALAVDCLQTVVRADAADGHQCAGLILECVERAGGHGLQGSKPAFVELLVRCRRRSSRCTRPASRPARGASMAWASASMVSALKAQPALTASSMLPCTFSSELVLERHHCRCASSPRRPHSVHASLPEFKPSTYAWSTHRA